MRILKIAINAVALLFAGLLVPGIQIAWSDDATGSIITLTLLAVIFGLVNTFVRPLARLVSLPLNIATLGLFSVVLNAALLLAVALIIDLVWQPLIVIGGFPPELTLSAVATAALGAFIISVVGTTLSVLIPNS